MSQPPLVVVVFDHTALLALGAGNQLVSRVSQAHLQHGWYMYAPAMCLAAAVAERPLLADHVGMLPAVEVVELGYAGAAAAGRLLADSVGWQDAQAIEVARPTVDWPDGRPVVTATPRVYAG